MNTDTGAIATFELEQDARDAGYDLMLTPEQAKALLAMNRSERRKWARVVSRQEALVKVVMGGE